MRPNIRHQSGLCNSCGKRCPEIGNTSFCFTTAKRPSLLGLDQVVASWDIEVLKSPAHAPTANAFCERLIRTIRRECLDYVIPLSESHLKRTLREWVNHYNTGRPHQSLGPGIPDQVEQTLPADRHPGSNIPYQTGNREVDSQRSASRISMG
jgi:hypothetical protein